MTSQAGHARKGTPEPPDTPMSPGTIEGALTMSEQGDPI